MTENAEKPGSIPLTVDDKKYFCDAESGIVFRARQGAYAYVHPQAYESIERFEAENDLVSRNVTYCGPPLTDGVGVPSTTEKKET